MTMLGAKILAARAVGGLARRSGRGGGTSLPGRVLVALEPQAIGELAARLSRGAVAISATNGKTTTATMIAAVLRRAGVSLVHNQAGANMPGGVASTLLAAARPGGGISGELGLFEIDEFWLDRLAPQLPIKALVLCNLFRDQLDRYGELERIADRWAAVAAALPSDAALVLNADDPLIADLGRDSDRVTYFGIQDDSVVLSQMQHASDSKHCRRCGAPYAYEAIFLGHLGRYHCPACGQRRPTPEIAAEAIELNGTTSASFRVSTPAGSGRIELPLPGLYNVYNALAAAALCISLGQPLATVSGGLGAISAAFGRSERLTIGGVELSILLMKNPAGANEILRTLMLESGELEILAVLNDRTADGKDISWIWDADFEVLASAVRSVICAGTRAAELGLRLKYAGMSPDRITVISPLATALDRALAGSATGRVFALPTYTALLELHDELARRGQAPRFWETAQS